MLLKRRVSRSYSRRFRGSRSRQMSCQTQSKMMPVGGRPRPRVSHVPPSEANVAAHPLWVVDLVGKPPGILHRLLQLRARRGDVVLVQEGAEQEESASVVRGSGVVRACRLVGRHGMVLK